MALPCCIPAPPRYASPLLPSFQCSSGVCAMGLCAVARWVRLMLSYTVHRACGITGWLWTRACVQFANRLRLRSVLVTSTGLGGCQGTPCRSKVITPTNNDEQCAPCCDSKECQEYYGVARAGRCGKGECQPPACSFALPHEQQVPLLYSPTWHSAAAC